MDANDRSPPESISALEDYAQSLIRRPPDPKRQRWIRVLITSLIGLVIVLSFVNLYTSSQFVLLSGSGTITGTVINGSGEPVAAEIYIERSTLESRSDNMGQFAIQGVPAGHQIIVVAHHGMGQEYPIVVTAGGKTDMGVVQVMETAVPGS